MNDRVRRWSVLLAAAGLTLVFTVQPFRYGDEWWHIALGRLVLRSGIPAQEPFSFVHAQHAWVEQQWLFEVMLAKVVDALGAGAASLLMGLAGSTALLVAALAVPRAARTGTGWRAAAIIAGGVVASPVMGVRGEVISMLGVAITLLIVTRWRDGSSRVVWALPPLFLLWANLHAGFVAGLAVVAFTLMLSVRATPPPRTGLLAAALLVAAFAAIIAGLVAGVALVVVLLFLLGSGEPGAAPRRPLLIAGALSVAATCVNPAGPGIYGYLVETFTNPLLAGAVSEWQSPDFHDTFNRLFEVSAVALVALWMLSPRRRLDQVLLAGGTFLASLQAVRNIPLFAIVAIPQLAEHGAAAWAQHGPRRRPLRPLPAGAAALLGALIVALALINDSSLLDPATAAAFEAGREPQAAARFAGAHHPGQRLLSSDTDGGYLAFRFPADRIVFIYPEIGVFGQGPLDDYRDIVGLRTNDWYERIGRDGMHAALLPTESAMTSALLEKGWIIECTQRTGRERSSGWVVMAEGGPPPAGTRPSPAAAPDC
jgi:hypothetical protein